MKSAPERRLLVPAIFVAVLLLFLAGFFLLSRGNLRGGGKPPITAAVVPKAPGGNVEPGVDTGALLDWFLARQKASRLLSSDEGTVNAYTYDQALAAIVFTAFGHPDRARRVLDFFLEKAGGRFHGFTDYYPVTGEDVTDARAAGPNAWIILAINFYTARTGDRRYLPLGRTIADWILKVLKTREGAVAGGTDPWGGPMSWVATNTTSTVSRPSVTSPS
ncbi:MAG: hypothetical protein D6679_03975 [Candidatus Hydrogenedentota bacterium]|nr:MAG: hypothetical protein D6679_03975 [Candidatus Hydrogenedentota bacterium]